MTTLAQVKINGNYSYLEQTAPTVNDDSTAGFVVGETWLDLTDGLSYQAADVTPGAAVWNRIEAALDTRINLILDNTYARIAFECIRGFAIFRNEQYDTGPDTINKEDLALYKLWISIYAQWTIAGTVLTSTDIAGFLTDLNAGDEVQLLAGQRNSGLRTIASVQTNGITLTGDPLVGATDRLLILQQVIPTDFDQIVGRMVYYDVVRRDEITGPFQSERIGTYSYTIGDNFYIGGLYYPKNVAYGLDSYLSAGPLPVVDVIL